MARDFASRKLIPATATLLCMLGVAANTQAQVLQSTIDNDSPNFHTTGAWANSLTGLFVGGNHIIAQSLSVVDNASASFTSNGSWSTSTSMPGFFGANYATTPMPAYHAPQNYYSVIIDNKTSLAGVRGCMQQTSSQVPGYYGANYVPLDPKSYATAKSCTFLFYGSNLPGNWGGTFSINIYAHWPSSQQNASNAKIKVTDSSGQTVYATYSVNQKSPSGEWYFLGAIPYNGSSLQFIFDSNGADGVVMADAIKMEATNLSSDNTAKWSLPSGLSGKYDIYARWPESSNTAEASPAWIVVGGDGSVPITNKSQRESTARWNQLATIDTTGTQKNYVQLEQFSSTGYLLADAIAYVPTSMFPSATWINPDVVGAVDIYLTWSADSSRASKASYIIETRKLAANGYCDTTSTLVSVNQTIQPSLDGYLLGSFNTASSSLCKGVSVTLVPDGAGTLSADSVTFMWLKPKGN
ncbi:MAG: hypothetical protein HY019_21195 [Aquabacterium sp.]|uniref:golvesin C-terminal-like domain-containing protein n=1 Tax=Aquabacterium sp. TaxID=1872578 RepID=UPI0025BA9BA2|nr:hypothetical protein [Aquabacterium sp.]MBI3384521.1 hypothetical protein [Aquabacterium sp.]